MGRRSDQLQLALLILFLALPVAVLVVWGPAEAYVYGRDQHAWPEFDDLFEDDSRGREAFADAFLDRLILRRESIRMRNSISLDHFGYIDADSVVSGLDRWLFYKPAFAAWDCSNHGRLDHGLHRLTLYQELALANDVPITFVNAPNKASIEPAASTGRARTYGECYFEYEPRARAAFRQLKSPHFIDHADVLLPRRSEGDVYLRGDTHWTRRSAFAAIRQLILEGGLARTVEGPPSETFEEKTTDLENQTLLLGEPTQNPSYSLEGVHPLTESPSEIVIVHDSFYQEVPDYLTHLIPEARLINLNFPVFAALELAPNSRVIVESVERAILSRVVSHAHFGWHSSVGRWFADRMNEASADCDWEKARDLLPETEYSNLKRGASGTLTATGSEPRLWTSLPTAPEGNSQCLALVLESEAEIHPRRSATIFLDARETQIDPDDRVFEFVHGRTVDFHYGRRRNGTQANRIAFVVPATASGKRIRVDFRELPTGTVLRSILSAPRKRM